MQRKLPPFPFKSEFHGYAGRRVRGNLRAPTFYQVLTVKLEGMLL